MKVFLVSWTYKQKGYPRSKPEFAHVECEHAWEAGYLLHDVLELEGYTDVETKVHRYIVKGETGVEDIS